VDGCIRDGGGAIKDAIALLLYVLSGSRMQHEGQY
jgi:hypothetical protein